MYLYPCRENTGLEAVIGRNLLLGLLGSAKEKYPRELFVLLGGFLSGHLVIVKEVIYVPWMEGNSHAVFFPSWIPRGVVGSFHSHPTASGPSLQDIRTFPLLGYVHLIAWPSFTERDVKAYDLSGREVCLRVMGDQRASF